MPSLFPARPWCLAAPCAGAVMLLAGCAAVPSQEMSDARVALDAAHQADAARWAPAATSRAAALLDEAAEALRAGDYEGARGRAAAARDEAILARRLAALVADAESGIAAAQTAGKPWRGAREMLEQALAVSRSGDGGRALEIATRALALVP